jgi:hypothetical protein
MKILLFQSFNPSWTSGGRKKSFLWYIFLLSSYYNMKLETLGFEESTCATWCVIAVFCDLKLKK